MPTTERDIGRILEALEQGKTERAHLRESLAETMASMSELREILAAMRAEFMMMSQRAEQASLLAARVTILEAGMGAIRNDLQALESFIKLAKQWSIKVVIGVLIALALGGAAFSKLIDLILRLPGPK